MRDGSSQVRGGGWVVERVGLAVKVIITVVLVQTGVISPSSRSPLGSSCSPCLAGKPEVSTKSSALLQCLRKHLIFPDVIITNRSPGEPHGLLEVIFANFWNGVLVIHFHV